ncbi:MAG: phosphoribosylformylglycinamidine synthase subunit PurQ, partial [Oscillospiraceae bacterium]|nr:phosphoribosylformylglycinamidine synthase subunit PurQ [Oscillospiraceae bacterium]
PTLVSFAVAPSDARNIITPEFKKAGSYVVLFPANENLRELKKTWKSIHRLIEEKVIISAWTVTDGGILEGIFKMSLGNELGFEFDSSFDTKLLSETSQGAIIAEVAKPVSGAVTLGMTSGRQVIKIGYEEIEIGSLVPIWENELESIFPTKTADEPLGSVVQASYDIRPAIVASEKFAKPRVLNLTFPGTNSELDVARSFSRAGGEVETLIVRNMTPALLRESVAAVAEGIKRSQIVMLPGGSSLGDEPDGSAKFINLIFREKSICEAISEHLNVRDGLMLGICNGFQALIKLGLVPFGQILIPGENSPTLSKNLIGRHQSKYVHTRICSVSSPWMSLSNVGDVHILPVSHGDGRLSATPGLVSRLASSGQIATQYTDVNGTASMLTAINPNGSVNAIEGLFSPDGRVFGKMAHTERASEHIAHNIYGNKHQPVFESGIYYFK